MIESLDAAGLLEPLLPEWAEVRFRAQHNPVHRFTVDRHLLETAAEAADLVRDVDRPDLLLVGALLHDIGKGRPGRDHSVVGAEMVEIIAPRMGFPPEDVEVLVGLARHHLLLPDTATRRDLEDVVTVSTTAEAVGSRTGRWNCCTRCRSPTPPPPGRRRGARGRRRSSRTSCGARPDVAGCTTTGTRRTARPPGRTRGGRDHVADDDG